MVGGAPKIPLIVGFGRGVRDDDGDDDMLKPWLATNMHFFSLYWRPSESSDT